MIDDRPEDEIDEPIDLEDARCFWCHGDGWDECDDPIQCTNEHRNGLCRCSSCGGSGLAKDMTIW